MSGAQIPTDLNAELRCYPVWWPIGQDWLSILLGQIAEPGSPGYWDGTPSEQSDAAVASLAAFYETLDKIDQGGCFMVGEIKLWPSADVPDGWQGCDGTFLAVDEYGELFDILGYSYGSGMGGDTFAVPNLKGRVPVGLDTGQPPYDQLGNSGGEESHTLTEGEMPSHIHETQSRSNATAFGAVGRSGRINATGTEANVNTTATGGGGSHNNMQPYRVLNYIIYIG